MKRKWNDVVEKQYSDKLNKYFLNIEYLGNDKLWKQAKILASNGKRVRAELIRRLIQSKSKVITNSVVQDAAALELIHLSTLIHDDIVDVGEIRRNIPTINVRYGNSIAIFVGNMIKDYAISIATNKCIKLLNNASYDVNYGQLLETMARNNTSLGISEYFNIIYYKSARMFNYCVEIASIHSNYKFGLNIKRAFVLTAFAYQIIDDWLDFVDSSKYTGKNSGLDSKNNIHSFIYASWDKTFNKKIENKLYINKSNFEIVNAIKIYSETAKNFFIKRNISSLTHDKVKLFIFIFCNKIMISALELVKKDEPIKSIINIFYKKLLSDIKEFR